MGCRQSMLKAYSRSCVQRIQADLLNMIQWLEMVSSITKATSIQKLLATRFVNTIAFVSTFEILILLTKPKPSMKFLLSVLYIAAFASQEVFRNGLSTVYTAGGQMIHAGPSSTVSTPLLATAQV